MADDKTQGPDFSKGVTWKDIADGAMTPGHIGDEAALLVRQGDTAFFVGRHCTHYGAPLEKGCLAGDTVRCPWHHAAFNLHTGHAERGPGIGPIGTWEARIADGRVYAVGEKRDGVPSAAKGPASVTIVGTGAAGFAALATLRQLGYTAPIHVFGAEIGAGYDRTKLSKAFLAGDCGDDGLALGASPLDLETNTHRYGGTRVVSVDKTRKQLQLESGRSHDFDALILATGAVPKRIDVPGADFEHVRVLRSHHDAKAIVTRVKKDMNVVVIGASFIGMEVAASLRKRGANVTVVNKHAVPLAAVLGSELGRHIQATHEQHAVRFVNNADVSRITATHVELGAGKSLPADLVVLGTGVEPAVDLARSGGLDLNDGVLVDNDFRSSRADVYAIGDIARWPNPFAKGTMRIEHWAVATRMGQAVARAILAAARPSPALPFFWTAHFDVSLRYVGHASHEDEIQIHGRLADGRAAVTYSQAKTIKALATIGCDPVSLACEKAMEAGNFDEAHRILRDAFA